MSDGNINVSNGNTKIAVTDLVLLKLIILHFVEEWIFVAKEKN